MKIAKRLAFIIMISLAVFIILFIYAVKSSSQNTNRTIVIESKITERSSSYPEDSLTVITSSYYKADFIKKFFQGKNYRKSWTIPVKVPKLNLDTLHGGVEIIKEGGGKQTSSLRIKNSEGMILTLRSVLKNPEELVPDYLKRLGLENIVHDGISAQHPYAALVCKKLSEEIDLLHTNPQLVFLPEQKKLKDFEEYKNQLYLLEYENKGTYNWIESENFQSIVDTKDLQSLRKELKDSLNINYNNLVRARLFDFVIGDWDRHAKQWGWVITKENDFYQANVLPTDRDNAFFNVDGLISQVLLNSGSIPYVQNFDKKTIDFENSVYDFDVYFLKNVEKKIFLEEAKYIESKLTDDKIKKAFDLWNKDLINADADRLLDVIIHKRNNLKTIALNFYAALQQSGQVGAHLEGSDFDDSDSIPVKCFECNF